MICSNEYKIPLKVYIFYRFWVNMGSFGGGIRKLGFMLKRPCYIKKVEK